MPFKLDGMFFLNLSNPSNCVHSLVIITERRAIAYLFTITIVLTIDELEASTISPLSICSLL